MEKQQPTKGNLLAAEKIDLTVMDDNQLAEYAVKLSEEKGVSARRQYRELEEARTIQQASQGGTLLSEMSNGYEFSTGAYKPNSGKDMMDNISGIAPERDAKKVSRFRKIGRKVLATITMTGALFAGGSAAAHAAPESAPVEQTVEAEAGVADLYESRPIVLPELYKAQPDTEANHESEKPWDIEYQTNLDGKQLEKNFGRAYEGPLTQDAIVDDILDRAKKDPAFLAAMTASCGVYEYKDVDTCTARYVKDFSERKEAYENLSRLLLDEGTNVTFFEQYEEFNSMYFDGTVDKIIDGETITVPAIGYSTDQLYPESTPSRYRTGIHITNKAHELDSKNLLGCGIQGIVPPVVEGVPEVDHDLQKRPPVKKTIRETVTIPIDRVSEVESPITSIPKMSVTTPESPIAIPEVDKPSEVPVTTPEAPTEPIEPGEPSEPTEPVEPVEPTEPTEPVEPVEPTEPEKPVVVPPRPIHPPKPPKPPTVPTTPVAPPVVDKPKPEPEKPEEELAAKDPSKSLETAGGIKPGTIEAGKVTEETKLKNPITGEQQSVEKPVTSVKAPGVDKQSKPHTPLKPEAGNEKPNQTPETDKAAKLQEEERDKQAITDAKQVKIDAEMKDKKKNDEAFESLRKSLEAKAEREKAERAERDRKADELAKASKEARLAAEQAAKKPASNGLNIKAQTPTVTEDTTK